MVIMFGFLTHQYFFCWQFLSMKLASVNTRMDFSVESLVTKDVSLRALDNGFAFTIYKKNKKYCFLLF